MKIGAPMRTLIPALLLALLPGMLPAAQTSLTVEFLQDSFLRVSAGSEKKVFGLDEEGAKAGTGILLSRGGEQIGRFEIVHAEAFDAIARVLNLKPGYLPEDIDHASIPELQLDEIAVQPLAEGHFFRINTGSADRPGIKHGDGGILTDDEGRTGALFSVVSVSRESSIASISNYAEGFFNNDLRHAQLRSYSQRIISGTGFANINLLNLIMLLIGCFFIYLGIAKEYEPLLLVPIGFGILMGNISLPLQVFNAISVYMVDPITHHYVFNTTGNSVLGLIYYGVRSGLLPPLIFLGIGALTDFSALLSSPRSVLLGAAAQVGIFTTFLGALALGFSPANAAAIGIIGGADGPTAIFLSSRLAPALIGPIAIAAYSYMAMVPIIQPPIMKLLTTRKERLIRMKPGRKISHREKILFPIAGMVLTTLVAPGGLPLLGMLFFGNLLKESGVTGRLSKTASTSLLDICTILLGVAVGASTSAQVFLTRQSMLIFVLGCLAFAVATAGGVLFAKFINLFSTTKINPLIGAAGVSAVPDSARVVHHVGQEEDPNNFLLQHAMGPNVAGVIGSAIAAGIFLGIF